jgi:hypothetical protein
MEHKIIFIITFLMGGLPWGTILTKNSLTQKIGIGVQIVGIIGMIINIILWIK